MDESFRAAERIWRSYPARENYEKYVRQCERAGVTPECYSCAVEPEITCSCGKASCKFCAAHCNDPDCDVFACPDCVDTCSICQEGICPGAHNTECDKCHKEFCLDCTRYCDTCGDLYCGNHMSDQDDFMCQDCYETLVE